MTDQERLEELKAELSTVFGRFTLFRRICAQYQATTTAEQIAVAEEVLKVCKSGSVNGGHRDWIMLKRLNDGVDQPSGTVSDFFEQRRVANSEHD